MAGKRREDLSPKERALNDAPTVIIDSSCDLSSVSGCIWSLAILTVVLFCASLLYLFSIWRYIEA